jgi:predicted Rossmann fold flavoprotein
VDWDAVIIGAGAAGLWAAGTAASRGKRVLVLEKNKKAGVKILMSGGTRCNVTHHAESRKIAEAFGKNGRVLLSVLSRLTPRDVVQEFEAEGVPTKVEATGKVFPVSDRAMDVRDAVVRRMARFGAEMITGCAVTRVHPADDGIGFQVHAKSGEQSMNLKCRSVLITTGGLSYSGCGTTGDGYGWARAMGHSIVPLRPALTPLVSDDPWVHALSGLTLDDVSVTAHRAGAKGQSQRTERTCSRGGFLWTHTGCSGPTAMNVSRCFGEQESGGNTNRDGDCILLDLVPDDSRESLEAWLLEESTKSNRAISTVLSQRIPKRLAEAMLSRMHATHDPHMAQLPKKLRQGIIEGMKRFSVPIHGTRGYPKAEVTAGGVALGEVNFQDMQSRKQSGLYFAGEILDLDGPIGGYNFQAAWSTGHTAGLHLG